MEQHIVKIISVHNVTHDVRAYRVEKPEGYQFIPGQATEVSIHSDKWKEERRPFTFTGLSDWPYLEFTIKSYHDHDGVTHALYQLQAGDELVIRDVWGAIAYKGPGCFLAGGAGLTPFIAILRQLQKDNVLAGNTLFFSNKKEEDIIYRDELDNMQGLQVHYILTREQQPGFLHQQIDEAFLKREVHNFSQPFYVCGPDKMVSDLTQCLQALGASPDAVVFEK